MSKYCYVVISNAIDVEVNQRRKYMIRIREKAHVIKSEIHIALLKKCHFSVITSGEKNVRSPGVVGIRRILDVQCTHAIKIVF